jgi:hypothetical protein
MAWPDHLPESSHPTHCQRQNRAESHTEQVEGDGRTENETGEEKGDLRVQCEAGNSMGTVSEPSSPTRSTTAWGVWSGRGAGGVCSRAGLRSVNLAKGVDSLCGEMSSSGRGVKLQSGARDGMLTQRPRVRTTGEEVSPSGGRFSCDEDPCECECECGATEARLFSPTLNDCSFLRSSGAKLDVHEPESATRKKARGRGVHGECKCHAGLFFAF